MRILIADDHPLVRQGLKQVLEAHADLDVVAEAKDGNDAVQQAGSVEWDVAVIDFNMPGKAGVELVKELRRRYPARPVLVLSMYPEDRYALRLLKAGAAGYLNKESAPEELVGALHKVAAGGRYVSAALGEKLALALSGSGEQPAYEKLSDREYQIMWLLASGKTVGEIAKQLFLSANTVSTYRARILKKISVKNNAELMRYAIRHQLVD
ncbi:MAG TPA: response regulator transcription factor [Burkholderiales bacterium]|nr:response regulator transcription factor [Burkholderiales bacterium]